jgi:excisionase family DNA binding protein
MNSTPGDGRKQPDPDMLADGFTGVTQAAEYLGISRSKIYAIMDSGELAYAKFGKARRIPRRALREFAAKCLVQGG